jgi:proline iminopeptidase
MVSLGLWGFLLKGLPDDRTRLVVSGYQSIRPRWLERVLDFWIYPPAHWTMQTRQFANLKRNIESRKRVAVLGE